MNRRIRAVAKVVLLEMIRRKDFYVLFILTALITAIMGSVSFFNDLSMIRYLKEVCLLLIWIASLILAIGSAARQIPNERESRTIFPLLAKPITRGQLLLGKFFGCWMACGLALLVLYLFFALVAASREHTFPVVNYLQAFTLHWFMLGVLIAFVLFGSIVFAAPSSNATITLVLTIAILVLARHLNKIALKMTEPGQSIVYGIYYALPHLELFDMRDLIIHDWPPIRWTVMLLALVYGAVYAALPVRGDVVFQAQTFDGAMKVSLKDVLIGILLFVACYGLGAGFDSSMQSWQGTKKRSRNLLATIFGDGTKLFANYFFVKSDIYFHRGYYPGIFDKSESIEKEGPPDEHDEKHEEHHDEGENFLGKPLDVIDRFSRNFYPSEHSHLGDASPDGDTNHAKDEVKEMLPWVRISTELDPNRPETYTLAAYWLRTRLGRTKEAEEFLREGWRENPDSYLILLELGRIYDLQKHDDLRAKNLYEAALTRWNKQQAPLKDPDLLAFHQIVSRLAMLEDRNGNYARAIELWEKLRPLGKGDIDKWIETVKQHAAEKEKAKP